MCSNEAQHSNTWHNISQTCKYRECNVEARNWLRCNMKSKQSNGKYNTDIVAPVYVSFLCGSANKRYCKTVLKVPLHVLSKNALFISSGRLKSCCVFRL